MALLTPDRYFSRITHVDIDRDLIGCGLTHVLLDMDNTILTRDTREVPRDVGMWLGRAREAGVSFCIVSNNWHGAPYRLAGELEIPVVAKAMKPLPPAFLVAMRKMEATRASTVVIGDQLATDVLGAHLVGVRAYMLQPLVEQDLRHTVLLRNFEQVVLGDRQPEPAAIARSGDKTDRGKGSKRDGAASLHSGASHRAFQVAGHVQRRVRGGGPCLELRRDGCARAARRRAVPR